MAVADNISPKQHKALGALLTSSTIGDAARAANVGERTMHAWLAEPTFALAYRTARREAVGQAISRLQQNSGMAVVVLLRLMADRSVKAPVRLAAASKVLDLAIKGVELDDILTRLEALEAAHDDTKP